MNIKILNTQKSYLVIFIILFLSMSSYAQKGWEVGGWVGTSQYYGDLNNRINIQDPGIALGLLGRYNFNHRVSWRGGLSFGRVGADDATSDNNFNRNRNLNFQSNLFDFSSGLEFNFFPYLHGSTDRYYTPYIFAGLNIFRFNPTTELNDQTYNLQEYGTEGQSLGSEYGLINGGFLLGGGFKWDINYDWSFNVEISYRSLWTDYLDDVSTVYPDFDLLTNQRGEIAAQLSDRSLVEGIGVLGRQRGDSTNNDRYVFFSFGIMKYFGRLECPAISDF